MRVFKFGGASLKDAEGIRTVGSIIGLHTDTELVVVVSATGKSTNLLEKVVYDYYHQTGNPQQYVDEFELTHLSIIKDLFDPEHNIFHQLNKVSSDLKSILSTKPNASYDQIYDSIVSAGELLSSYIVHAWLNHSGIKTAWLDARSVIKTDENFREGRILWNDTLAASKSIIPPLFEESKVIVTQGFLGGTLRGQTTTLGREGSDYSAAIISFCLDAENQTIWKDVPGVLNADPRKFENAILIDKLSYREAIEMTYYGASVIHPKTIQPLQRKNIPLLVKSFINPEGEGTLISADGNSIYPPVVVLEMNQILLQISTRDFSFVAEHHLSDIFKKFADVRVKVNMMQNSAISFSACITNQADKVDRLLASLRDQFKVDADDDLELLTIRHYNDSILHELKRNRIIILEEKLSDTVQMITKRVPQLKMKA
ncbi:MAG TPA: aspartate kinase [Saprospiraceae bacterium]|nr:aspartate kinase [Saprospiraceae bacterium]